MTSRGRLAAGIVGCLTLFAIGWTGLLIPSLVRSIEATFDQTDAGVGLVYLAYSIAYATGSFGGGPLTERIGRRLVLGGGVLIHGLGIAGLGLAPSWGTFIAAAMVAALGAGCLDGGSNGLVLDVYREGRGRAMNLLHVSFSAGALAAPLIVGRLVEGGVPWQTVVIGGGCAHPAAGPRLRLRPDAERPTRGGRASGHRGRDAPAVLTVAGSWPVPCSCSASPSRRTSPPRSASRTGWSGSSIPRRSPRPPWRCRSTGPA